MTLASFIIEHMEQLLLEWDDYARTLFAAKLMEQPGLRDHAKVLLESIANDLASPQTNEEEINKSKGQSNDKGGVSNKLDASAKEHSLSRLDSGFSIENIVSEYRALRASVFRLWGKLATSAQQSDLGEMTRFNEAIDQVLAESVTTYADEKKLQVRFLNAMLSSSLDHNFLMGINGRL